MVLFSFVMSIFVRMKLIVFLFCHLQFFMLSLG